MNVASRERFLGEFNELPSSWGGSLEVSLTVNRSGGKKERKKKKVIASPKKCFHIKINIIILTQTHI